MELNEAILSSADFRRTDLFGANFFEANFSNAALRGANLRYSGLGGANLSGANLQNTDLANTIFVTAMRRRLKALCIARAACVISSSPAPTKAECPRSRFLILG